MQAPYASIDWIRSDFDLELTCLCGQWSAASGYYPMQPTVQCPCCDRIFHTDSNLELFPEGTDYRKVRLFPGPQNCFQWKNITAHLTCHCRCGAQFEASGDFLYRVTCPACNAKYDCAMRLAFREIQASEAPGSIHRLDDSTN